MSTYGASNSDVAALILRYQDMGIERGNEFANGLLGWRINESHPTRHKNPHRTQIPVFITKQLINDNPQHFMNLEPHEIVPKSIEISMTYMLENDPGRFFPTASANKILAQDMGQLVTDSQNINRRSSALLSLYKQLNVTPQEVKSMPENKLYELLTSNIDIVDRHVDVSRSSTNVQKMLYNPLGHISTDFDLNYDNQAAQKFNDSLQTMDYSEWLNTQKEINKPNLETGISLSI